MKAEAKQRCDAVPQTGALDRAEPRSDCDPNNLGRAEGQPAPLFAHGFVHVTAKKAGTVVYVRATVGRGRNAPILARAQAGTREEAERLAEAMAPAWQRARLADLLKQRALFLLRDEKLVRALNRERHRGNNARRSAEARRLWLANKRRTDASYRLTNNFRSAIHQCLRGVRAPTRMGNWTKIMGYTLADLQAHLEAQFRDGMSWENMGAWHIDHIRPLASFKITGRDCPEFRAAWALSNLQPLWAVDNLRKGARYE